MTAMSGKEDRCCTITLTSGLTGRFEAIGRRAGMRSSHERIGRTLRSHRQAGRKCDRSHERIDRAERDHALVGESRIVLRES